ncbi:methylated-dna--protein-cysteine methyltransferase [hydrocarbon metagenome]|uniref:Methylated-dna--protein-cysteine methyltransferase n=1 Tax=hydrocarbon metagenome TaxID=938273 RepID=A0A0W8E6K4_9ZZZZ
MKCWYLFNTINGSMAVLREDNTLCRLLLPSPNRDLDELARLDENASTSIIQISPEDNSIPLINKIRAYYQGKVIHDWGVIPDISSLPPFYRRSLEYVFTIPYGTTRTYGEVARAIGSPLAARAVGQANRNNPIPLVIPCHRVVGTNSPGGFSGPGGVEMKMEMIDMEKANLELPG